MSLRISSAAGLLALAACSAESIADRASPEVNVDDRIDCALGGTGNFSQSCVIERGEGERLTLRHDNGGFRRLTLEADGTIDTADGAEGMTVQPLSDGRTEVVIGADRYRLPATL